MICQGLSLYSILFYCPTGWDKHKSHSCSGSCRSWRITNHKMVWNLNLCLDLKMNDPLTWNIHITSDFCCNSNFIATLALFPYGIHTLTVYLLISSYWVQYCCLIGRAGFSEEVDKSWMVIRGSLTPTRTSQLSSKRSKITATYFQVVTSRERERERERETK
jgi:hypothetical protein